MKSFRLRPFFHASARVTLPLALILALAFAAIRAFAMLGPSNYRPLFLLHCFAMALVPWILLDVVGRAEIGLKSSIRPWEYPLSALCGAAASLVCFVVGLVLFGVTPDNWFVSVGNSFRAQPTDGLSLVQLHLMFTIPAMLFSPIGEEIFFRGFLQRALETKFNARTSALLEGTWFATVHLVHHGLVAVGTGLEFRALSGTLWFVLMLSLSCVFAWLRKRHDSIVPAILAHSAFNLVMNVFIFGFLWNAAQRPT